MSTQFDAEDDGDLFDDPGATTALDLNELLGRLLVIKPKNVARDVNTVLGPKDATVADIVVLDGGNPQPSFADAYVWPKVLQSQLRPTAGTGRFCLGRLGKGVAKQGQSAPWVLDDPTDDDRAVARAYLSMGMGA